MVDFAAQIVVTDHGPEDEIVVVQSNTSQTQGVDPRFEALVPFGI